MLCPYCQSTLKSSLVDTKTDQPSEIQECLNCGGHWFPRWLANDVSLTVAKNTDSIIPQTTVTPPDQPRCPVCQYRLSLIKHDSVARGVTVWACPQGHGNFFPIHDLLRFKQAQDAKINYHQVWGIPIKSVFAVLLPVVALITIAAGTPLIIHQVQLQQETRTKASQTINQPLITQLSPTSAIISFTSSSPLTTEISIYQDNRTITTLPVSTTPKTTHSITVPNLVNSTPYTFIILYTTITSQTSSTTAYPLILN